VLVHQKHHQESKVLMTPRRDQRRTQTRRRLPLLRRPRRIRKRSKLAAALNLPTPDHPQMRSQSSQRGLEPHLTLVLKVVPAIPAPRRARPLRSRRSKRYRKRRRPFLHLPPVQEAIVTSQRSLLKKLQQRKLLRAHLHLQALIVTATSHKRRHQSRRLPPHPVAPVAIPIQTKSQSRRLQ